MSWRTWFEKGIPQRLAPACATIDELAEKISAEVGEIVTKDALDKAHRRWRDRMGMPMLSEMLAPRRPAWDPEAAKKRKDARRGWSPENDMTHTVPDGFAVKGVSTLYDAEGNVRSQWVKSSAENDRLQMLADAVATIAEPFRGESDATPGPDRSNDDLLCVYPMGDPHLGMYAWAEETGSDFDLDIAERNLVRAVDHLVDLAPDASSALIINLGDFFHADNQSNKTSRSGNVLDVDTRWAKVLRAGIRTTIGK